MDWAERFEARIERTESCWNWTGFIDREGYGLHRRTGDDNRRVHRLAHELWIRPIPAGLTVDHLCHNRRCVNPAHLEAVTIGENVRRSREATKTHCVNGHEFDAPNTHVRANGHRECRPCMRDRARAYRRRRRLVNT